MVETLLKLIFFLSPPHPHMISLCSSGCPETDYVDQDGLELRNLPVSVSHVLGLKDVSPHPAEIYFLKIIKQKFDVIIQIVSMEIVISNKYETLHRSFGST